MLPATTELRSGVMECRNEVPTAQVEHVEHPEQPHLAQQIAMFFRNGEASVQGCPGRVAFSMHVHQGGAEARLKMHLLGSAAIGIT